MMNAKSAAPRRRSRWIGIFLKIVGGFVALSLLMVVIYRFVPPPVTWTMLLDPNGITKDWMSLDRMDTDMARAAIAAEDSRFCSHNGFNAVDIDKAVRHHATGGRIRRSEERRVGKALGSTIRYRGARDQ